MNAPRALAIFAGGVLAVGSLAFVVLAVAAVVIGGPLLLLMLAFTGGTWG